MTDKVIYYTATRGNIAGLIFSYCALRVIKVFA